VAEAAVVGKPHDIKAKSVFAYVVCRGQRPEGDSSALVRAARVGGEQLGAIEARRSSASRTTFPKNALGKIMRRLLKAIARGEESPRTSRRSRTRDSRAVARHGKRRGRTRHRSQAPQARGAARRPAAQASQAGQSGAGQGTRHTPYRHRCSAPRKKPAATGRKPAGGAAARGRARPGGAARQRAPARASQGRALSWRYSSAPSVASLLARRNDPSRAGHPHARGGEVLPTPP